jgi:RNA recognition motif-containing protein
MNIKTLYVGNFPFSMTDPELQSIFEPYGTIENAKIVSVPEMVTD